MQEKIPIKKIERAVLDFNLSELGSKKADTVVGGLKDYVGDSKKGQCGECGRDVFLHDAISNFYDLVQNGYAVLCPYCIKKNHMRELTSHQLMAMVDAINYFEYGEKNGKKA